MGVRINKAVGFGFTDFEGPEDSRVLESRLFSDPYFYEDEMESYRDWFIHHKEEVIASFREMNTFDAPGYYDDCEDSMIGKPLSSWTPQVWNPEDASTILWIPPTCKKELYRYNDSLDWVQAKLVDEDLTSKTQLLWSEESFGIPSLYRAAVPKDEVAKESFLALLPLGSQYPTDWFVSSGGIDYNHYKALSMQLGIAFTTHFWTNWKPIIPEELLLFFKKCKVLSPEAINDLRPIYYRWWE